MMRAAIVACAALSCSAASSAPSCLPGVQRCRENAVEVCSVGVWVTELDCLEHNSVCSVLPNGDAVCARR